MKTLLGFLKRLPWIELGAPGAALAILVRSNANSAALQGWLRTQPFGAELAPHAGTAYQVAFWLVGAWLLDGAVRVFAWNLMSRGARRKGVPSFLRKTVTTVIFMLALTGIAIQVFHYPLTGLWATSGAFGLAIGFAQKKLIGDFFAGIAMSVDPAFRLGDWIMVRLPGEDTIYGQVAEMDWRLTWLESRNHAKRIAIPYSLLVSASVTTLYKPVPRQRFEVHLSLEEAIPVDRAIRILEAATAGIPGILDDPRPQVIIHDSDNAGIVYCIRYWIGPDVSMDVARHSVFAAAFTALYKAGVATANDKQEIFVGRFKELGAGGHPTAADMIASTPLFRGLSEEEVRELSALAQLRYVRPGENVVTAGDPGSSMFILCEGALEVFLSGESGEAVRAARLRAGDFFGEMSLLTGDPRSATVAATTEAVLYEIGKESLEPLLMRNHNIAEEICRIVDERRAANIERMEKHAAARSSGWLQGALLGRMRKFFKLPGK